MQFCANVYGKDRDLCQFEKVENCLTKDVVIFTFRIVTSCPRSTFLEDINWDFIDINCWGKHCYPPLRLTGREISNFFLLFWH